MSKKKKKSPNPEKGNRPFKNLKKMLREKDVDIPSPAPTTGSQKPEQPKKPIQEKEPPDNDQTLFMEAMQGVKPVKGEKQIDNRPAPDKAPPPEDRSEEEVLAKLKDLVETGKGFVVSATSEYIEGTAYNVNPEIAKKLHRGDFSIQAHIDLHGFTVLDATEVFDDFLRSAIETKKNAVLIVHGRGLSSPEEPVLKTKVIEWLTRGPFRKWVIAFTSARACDGGTGATYVLLRDRPFTKRERKRKKPLTEE